MFLIKVKKVCIVNDDQFYFLLVFFDINIKVFIKGFIVKIKYDIILEDKDCDFDGC